MRDMRNNQERPMLRQLHEMIKDGQRLRAVCAACVATMQTAEKTLSSRRASFCLSCGSGFGIKREAASRDVRCSLLCVMIEDR